jgi:two-component sensor histidine kinase
MPLTADISRADLLLCTLLPDGTAGVVAHGMPQSISSLYKENASGRVYTGEELPLVLRALQNGAGGRRQREVLRSGAPMIEDVYPVANRRGRVVAAFVVETTMIAHERQRRRDRHFQQSVGFLLEMCALGELASAERLTRFGLYDGIYLVDRSRNVLYMSGIAANLFRTIGLPASLHNLPLSHLEPEDSSLVDRTFSSELCLEERLEGEDGRTWIRRAIPVRMPTAAWPTRWFTRPVGSVLGFHTPAERPVAWVLVLLHNATEAVAKQRELNVKSALIQEVHHRVKNNLQNIAAILRMQARRSQSDETRQHLTDAVNRVLSMSVIHEFLSQSDSRSINVRDVCLRIANQVKEVSRNPEQEIEVRVQGPNIRLPASQATPASMVINELLLNALEHGIKGRAQGIITIVLTDMGDSVRLEVCDDGEGLPPDFRQQQSPSLGLQIVRTLVTDDLKGSIRWDPLGEPLAHAGGAEAAGGPIAVAPPQEVPRVGTRATVTFPKRPIHVD